MDVYFIVKNEIIWVEFSFLVFLFGIIIFVWYYECSVKNLNMRRLVMNLLDQIRNRIRVKHYSIRDEESYVNWVKTIYFIS